MKTLGLIGCGMIGGSVALAAKRHGCFDRVLGQDSSYAAIEDALNRQVIDAVLNDLKVVDAVCIAVPTQSIASEVTRVVDEINSSVPVFDVGSVKGSVYRELEQVPPNFIGCHPVAGSHRQGVQAAKADLFQGSVCVLTPVESSDENLKIQLMDFWESLGARTVLMKPDQHDRAVALTSHLPHLLAVVAVKQIESNLSLTEDVMGSGFRDFTRIAAGDAKIWRDIFANNYDNLCIDFRQFADEVFSMLRLANSDPETLERELRQIADFRSDLDAK